MSPRPARSSDALQLTPFLLATILGALVSTTMLIAIWEDDDGSSPSAGLIVAVGVTSVAWAAVIFVFCRDTILRRIDDLSDQLTRASADLRRHVTATMAEMTEQMTSAATELAEQAEASGVFRGIDMEARRHTTPARRLRAVDRVTEPQG